MSFKKSSISLLAITLFYLGIMAFYISSPIYLGYYPIGIIFLLLLVSSIVSLILFSLKSIFIEFKRIQLRSVGLFAGYMVINLVILYSLFIWFAFMP